MDAHLGVEGHFLRILDCCPSVIYTKDLHGCYTSVNKQFEVLSGLRRSDVLGKSDFALFPQSVAENSTKNDRHVVESGRPLEIEEFAPVQGKMHWFSSIKYPLVDDNGKTYGICGISTDITERKSAQEKLKKSEERYKALFDQMPTGCAIYSVEGEGENFIFKDFNKASEKIENIKKDELLGKPVTEVFPEVKNFGKFEVFQDVWRSGEPKYFPPACYKNNYDDDSDPGSWRESWVYKLDNGDIVSLYNDVTQRIHTEKALEESEERYRLLFENADVLISVYDRNGFCQLMNKKVASLFGGSPEEFIGKAFSELHPDSSEEYTRRIRQAVDTGISNEYEDEVVFSQGSRWLLSKVHPVYSSAGNIISAQIISQDITDRKRAEAELRDRLKELNCLYGISHLVESGKTLPDILQGIADIVPGSWQYPQITSCRIVLDENDIRSKNHCEESCDKCLHTFLNQPIFVNGNIFGEIRVCYTEERPEADEGPFLREERALINAIAERIGRLSEREKTEKALHESENRYRTLFEFMEEGFLRANKDGNITLVNRATARMFGYETPDDMIGIHMTALYADPKDREKVIYKLQKNETIYNHEIIVKTKNGEPFWVLCNLKFIRDEQHGGIIGTEGLIRDINDRKLAKIALKESESRFRSIFNLSQQAIALTEIDTGKLLMVNNKLCEFAQYSEKELVGKTTTELGFYSKNDRKKFIDKLSSTGHVDGLEMEFRTKDGSKLIALMFANIIKISGLNYILTEFFNMTTQKILERKLIERNKDLLLAQRIANVGNWSLDPEINVFQWSEEVYRIFERGMDLGPYSLNDLREIYFDIYSKVFNKAIQGAIKKGRPYDIELKLELPSGKKKWIRTICEPYSQRGPKGHYLQGTIQDITKIKESEKALQKALAFNKAIVDSSQDCIKILDLEGNLLFMSQGGQQLLEIDDINLYLNESWIAFWKDKDYINAQKAVLSAKEGGIGAFEGQCFTEKGIPKWWDILISPIYDETGGVRKLLSVSRDITDRKRIENALKENEEQLRKFFENAPVGIFQSTPEGKYLQLNSRFAEMLGYPPKELSQMDNISDLYIVPFQRDEVKNLLAEYGAIEDYHIHLRRKDGGDMWMSIFVQARRDESGKISFYDGFTLDITKRKKTQEVLARVRYSIDKVNDTILWVDSDGKFFDANDAACRNLGFDRSELLKLGVADIDPNFPQEVWPVHWQDMKKRGTKEIESIHQMKSGKRFPVEIFIHNQQFGDERYNCVFARDITERKQAEEALKDSEERLKAILETVPDPIIVYDNNGYPVYLNPAFSNLFGWNLEEISGRTIPFVPEDQKELTFEKIKELYKYGKIARIDSRRLTKDGVSIDVVVSAATIKGPDGSPTGVVVCLTDMRKAKELEEQVRHLHKMEAVGTLAGGIAHELNNMLGIIIGNTELALEDIPEWNPVADCLQEIRTASLRAKDVVRKLLSFARKTPITKKPLYIGSIIKESLDLMRRTIPSTIDIRKNIGCSTGVILGDPTEINQVVINLCTNSVHAMTEDNGVLEVGLDTIQLNQESAVRYEDLQPGDYARLTVKDTGEGIEPVFRERLFDPYFTTKDVDQGLGMGLAVVHGIVKKHDGAIKIESEVGKGTIVEVLFPLIKEKTVTITEEIETFPKGTVRILLVDDEPSIVKMITQMLKRSGFEVIDKTSSSDALKAFKETPEQFDLVISDMAMPEMPGDRLAQEIKKIRHELPIILCTGHSDRVDESKAKEIGIEAFIMKPFSKRDIANTVRNVLDEAKS